MVGAFLKLLLVWYLKRSPLGNQRIFRVYSMIFQQSNSHSALWIINALADSENISLKSTNSNQAAIISPNGNAKPWLEIYGFLRLPHKLLRPKRNERLLAKDLKLTMQPNTYILHIILWNFVCVHLCYCHLLYAFLRYCVLCTPKKKAWSRLAKGPDVI